MNSRQLGDFFRSENGACAQLAVDVASLDAGILEITWSAAEGVGALRVLPRSAATASIAAFGGGPGPVTIGKSFGRAVHWRSALPPTPGCCDGYPAGREP